MSTKNITVTAGQAPEGIELFIPPVYEIVWSAIYLLALFLLFWKLILPRMKTALRGRTEGIEKKLEQAESDRAEAQALLEQYREQLADARSEAAQIRTDAQSERSSIIAEARTEAEQAARGVTERAEAQMAAEAASVRAGLSRDVGRLATDLATKIVGENLDESRTSATVDRFIADLEAATADDGTTPQGRTSRSPATTSDGR